jgi:hypothetical protein
MEKLDTKSQQDVVRDMIAAGTHTRQQIVDAVGCTPGSFASYLTAFRAAAKFTGAAFYPYEVVEDTGLKIIKFGTVEDAAKYAPVRVSKTSGSASNPFAMQASVEAKLVKLNKQLANLSTQDQKNKVVKLKTAICKANIELATLEQTEVAEVLESLSDAEYSDLQAQHEARIAEKTKSSKVVEDFAPETGE